MFSPCYGSRKVLRSFSLFLLFQGLWLTAPAGAATFSWTGNALDTDWLNPNNWNPATGFPGSNLALAVPTDLALFSTNYGSNVLDLTLDNAWSNLSGITFNAGALPVTLTVQNDGGNAALGLFLRGAGLVNNSGFLQTLSVEEGFLQLQNSASLGGYVSIWNRGDGQGGGFDSTIIFNSLSTAGRAQISQMGTAAGSANTIFQGSSSAGSALIRSDAFSSVLFLVSAKGGTSSLLANSGGTIAFLGASVGENAAITTNQGGTLDISGHTGALSVGSINGNGDFILGANTLTTGNNNASTVVTGVISGTGKLIKAGTGTMTLSGTNTYTGGTAINAGVLELGEGGTTGSIVGNVTTAKGTLLTLNRSDAVVFSNVVSGLGGLTQKGSGETILTGANTYTGTTTITNGQLTVGNGGATGSIASASVVNNGILSFNRSNALTYAGAIRGTGEVVMDGSGTLILSGINTHTGGTTLDGTGTLTVGNVRALGSSTGDLTVNSGFLNLNGNSVAVGTLSGTGGVIGNTSSKKAGVLSTTMTADGIFAGVIQNGPKATALRKGGSGTLTLTGNNTYTGGTTITAGRLELGDGVVTGTIQGGVSNAGVLEFNGNSTYTMGGAISGTGSVEVTGGAAQVLTLSGANSYTGGTVLNADPAGIVKAGSTSALGAATGKLTVNTGTLDVNGRNIGVGVLSGTGGAITNGSATASTLTVSPGLSASGTYAGNITNGVGTLRLVKNGVGTLGLSGVNTYSGGTLINAGRLNINSGTALGSGLVSIAGTGVILDNTSGALVTSTNAQSWNANFAFGGSNDLTMGTGGVTMSGSRVVTVNGSTLTIASAIGQSATSSSLTKSGSGTLVLTGNNTYSGGTIITAGKLNLGDGTATSTILGNVNTAGTLGFNGNTAYAFNGIISGTGGVEVSGGAAQVLTLNGTNTYSGGTVINADAAGSVILGNAKALGATTGALTVNSGTLDLNGRSLTVGVLSGSGGVITNGSVTGSTMTVNPALSAGGEFAGNITNGAGSIALVKSGAGTLGLSGTNTYSGGTVVNAGRLNINSNEALGTGQLTLNGIGLILDNTSGAAVTLSNNNVQVWNENFTFQGSNDLNLGTGAVTMAGNRILTVNGSTLTVGGAIGQSGGSRDLIKNGAGILVLAGDNTYSDGTTIAGGRLELGNGGVTGSVLGRIVTDGTAKALLGSGVLGVNRSDNIVFSNQITGNGGFEQMGSGDVTLTGNNTYKAGTTLSGAGRLILGSNTALGATTGNLTVENGTLDLNGRNLTVGVLSGGAGTITNGSATASTLTVNPVLSAGGEFAGDITNGAGSIALVKNGAGTLGLSGTNTYSGGTVLNAGQLNINSNEALGTGQLTISSSGVILDNTSGAAVILTNNNTQGWNGNFTFQGSNDLDLGTGAVSINANRSLAVNGSTLTVGGAIGESGSGRSLSKSGAGTLVFTANNTYSGGTTITGGRLELGDGVTNGSVIGDIATGVTVSGVSSSGVLALNLSGNGLIFGNKITGTGGLEQMGPGDVTLTGANMYSGGTTLNGTGGLIMGSATALGASQSALTVNSGTLDLNGNNLAVSVLSGIGGAITNGSVTGSTMTVNPGLSAGGEFAGNITNGAGSIALVKNGVGTLGLSGVNTYSGGTVVNAGRLNINSNEALGTGQLTINGPGVILDNSSGAAVTLSNNNVQVWNENFTFQGSDDLDLGTGAVTITGDRTVAVNGSTLTVGGAVGESGGSRDLIKTGTGTLVLAGGNTYSDTTLIAGGRLELGNGGVTGSVLGGIVTDGISKGLTGSGVLGVNRSDNIVFSNQITGNGGFDQMGSGSVTLTGNNTYKGGTTLSGSGSLILGSNSALGASTGNLTVDNGTLDLNGRNLTVGVLSGGGGTITNGVATASTLTVNPVLSASGEYTGDIIDGAGSIALVKNGAGTLGLSGTNTYSGGTVVNAGQLNINSNEALGTGQLVINSNGVVLGNTSGGTITLTNNNAQVWNGNFTYQSDDNLNMGTGGVTLTGNRTVTVNNGQILVGGVIGESGGSRSLTLAGTGLMFTAADNTYTGGTTINGGLLVLGIGGNTGSILGNVSVNNGFLNGGLGFNRNDTYSYNGNISGNGSVLVGGTGTQFLTLGGNNSYTGGTNLFGAGTTIMGSATALGATTGNLQLDAGTLDLNNFGLTVGLLSGSGGIITNSGAGSVVVAAKGAGNTTFAGVIQNGAGTTGFTKTGAGLMILTGNQTYTGSTTIGAGSVLQLGSGGVSGSLSAGTSIQNNGSLTVNRSDAVSMANRISGTGSVRQSGSGTLLLSGLNTYSGGTVVENGILQVGSGSALGSGSLTLSGGTLATDGIQTQINIAQNLTWNTNGQIALTLAPDLDSEFININGSLLKLGVGTLNFEFTPSGLPPGHTSFMVMYAAGGFGNLTSNDFSFTDPNNSGLDGTFSIQGNYLYFNDAFEPLGDQGFGSLNFEVSQVPEPSTYMMLLLGLGGVATWSKIRRRQS